MILLSSAWRRPRSSPRSPTHWAWNFLPVLIGSRLPVMSGWKSMPGPRTARCLWRLTPVRRSLRGAQLKKIGQDILKLALLKREATFTGTRAIIAFASAEARDSVRGWLRRAADAFGVELLVVAIPEDLRNEILSAQSKQMMMNVDPTLAEIADDVDATLAEIADDMAPAHDLA